MTIKALASALVLMLAGADVALAQGAGGSSSGGSPSAGSRAPSDAPGGRTGTGGLSYGRTTGTGGLSTGRTTGTGGLLGPGTEKNPGLGDRQDPNTVPESRSSTPSGSRNPLGISEPAPLDSGLGDMNTDFDSGIGAGTEAGDAATGVRRDAFSDPMAPRQR